MSEGDRKDYVLDSYVIASGGFADVFGAKQKSTGRRVAFKKVRAGVRNAKERFVREIEVMRALSHPNVMPLLDADENHQWYVMPIADGSLTDLARTLQDEALEACLVQVAEGLKEAHRAGYVHRDVTPNNILRIRDAAGIRWVVADWGLVRRPPGQTDELRTQNGLGTEGFAAPEVWSGEQNADLRADIYSLGRVIAWAFTRMLPAVNVDLPAPGKWKVLVAKMTMSDRSKRHEHLDDVLKQLKMVSETGFARQLVAVGPHIVCEGEIVEVSGQEWLIELDRFVVGDEARLLEFSDGFDQMKAHDRCITIERRGESRIVVSPPRCVRTQGGWTIRVSVGARAERPDVNSIGSDLSIRTLESVSGIARMPQIFEIALSTERGEMMWAPDFGSFVRRRFTELGDTPLFERVVGLESMRLASIPYAQRDGSLSLPLRCVERILSLKLAPGRGDGSRQAHVVAEVNGFGQWEGDIEILVEPAEPDAARTPLLPSPGTVMWAGIVGGESWKVELVSRGTLWTLKFINAQGKEGGRLLWDRDADSVAHRTPELKEELVDVVLAALRAEFR